MKRLRTAERPWGIPRAPEYPGESRRVAGRLATDGAEIEEVEYAAGLCIARHAHGAAQIIYIEEGTHWSGHSRGGDECPPGTVRFLPPGEPHENYFPAGSRCLGAELRDGMLRLAEQEGRIPEASGELAGGAARQGARLVREFRQRDDLTGLAIDGLLVELLLWGVGGEEARRGRAPRWLLGVRERLHEEEPRHLTLGELARTAGRHPVQVCRQFRQHFGCTISEYVRQTRVARAQLLLTRGEMSVAEIALASGFADQSHFTNAFRRVAGMPPHQYRKRSAERSAEPGG